MAPPLEGGNPDLFSPLPVVRGDADMEALTCVRVPSHSIQVCNSCGDLIVSDQHGKTVCHLNRNDVELLAAFQRGSGYQPKGNRVSNSEAGPSDPQYV